MTVMGNEVAVSGKSEADITAFIAQAHDFVREMNTKYKETSEGGLAVSVVLC